MSYTPPQEILEKYADLLINFALGNCKGIKPGDVVWMRLHESAKPFYAPLRNAILKAGGHPLIQYYPDGVGAAEEYDLSSPKQLEFGFDKYYGGIIEQVDHMVYVISEADKYELQDVEPSRIITKNNALRSYMKQRNAKESAGKFTWTIGMYGTPAMAADVGLSEEEYWGQIIKACYLDAVDPKVEWKRVTEEIERVREALNALSIQKLHVEGEHIDLWVGLGANRQWLGGSGANIPSFELFVSPDWRQTNGEIFFNQPLYRYGNSIEGIKLRFKDGVVVESSATKGEALLKELLATENADKIGEYSLTDGSLSRITHLMGETLYDENMGGTEGNTHLAVGNAYQSSYTSDPSTVTDQQWKDWGYNQSQEHTDIISTEKRTVTAILPDGSEKIIYSDGHFTL
ncbi:MAG: aminopeptidase [bacterium]